MIKQKKNCKKERKESDTSKHSKKGQKANKIFIPLFMTEKKIKDYNYFISKKMDSEDYNFLYSKIWGSRIPNKDIKKFEKLINYCDKKLKQLVF